MIISTKLKSIILSVLIISITIGSTLILANPKASAKETTETSPRIGYTVVLDAAHGGRDVK